VVIVFIHKQYLVALCCICVPWICFSEVLKGL